MRAADAARRPRVDARGPAPAPPGARAMARHDGALTHVTLTWFEQRLEHWIRFGRHVGEHIIDRRRRVLSFAPGARFAFVRWAANDHGTIFSRIDIVVAVAPGAPFTTLRDVRPGGDILLSLTGWPKVRAAFAAIDAVAAAGVDPADAAPDHWRHVHNRLSAGEAPRLYTRARHDAWRARDGVSS